MSTMTAPTPDWQLESGEIEHLHKVREAQSKNLRRALLFASMSYLTLMVLVMLGLLAKRNAPKADRTVVVPYRELQAPPHVDRCPHSAMVARHASARWRMDNLDRRRG